MSFLPKGFEAPTSGGRYKKMKEGDNRFRPVGEAVVGAESWLEVVGGKRQVHRRVLGDGESMSEGEKMFVAFAALDRDAGGQVVIVHVTQATIMDALETYSSSPDWGDPHHHETGYDIVVNRKGTGFDNTKYAVFASPKKPLTPDERRLVVESPVSWSAYFDGDDPFAPSTGSGQAAPAPHAHPINPPAPPTPASVRDGAERVVMKANTAAWREINGLNVLVVSDKHGVEYMTHDMNLATVIEAITGLADIWYVPTARGNRRIVDVETTDIPF